MCTERTADADNKISSLSGSRHETSLKTIMQREDTTYNFCIAHFSKAGNNHTDTFVNIFFTNASYTIVNCGNKNKELTWYGLNSTSVWCTHWDNSLLEFFHLYLQ